jgi:hypothetical protein
VADRPSFNPKKSGPDHAVPVIAAEKAAGLTATPEEEENEADLEEAAVA